MDDTMGRSAPAGHARGAADSCGGAPYQVARCGHHYEVLGPEGRVCLVRGVVAMGAGREKGRDYAADDRAARDRAQMVADALNQASRPRPLGLDEREFSGPGTDREA